jgi:hypothetical protein
MVVRRRYSGAPLGWKVFERMENFMMKTGAALFLAGIFVAGGTAIAGPDPKCAVCHFPGHDPTDAEGDVILMGNSAWEVSHKPHGDCMIDVAFEDPVTHEMVMGHSADGVSCTCDLVTETLPE